MVRSRLIARAALLGRVLIKGAMVVGSEPSDPTSRNRGVTEKTEVRTWVNSKRAEQERCRGSSASSRTARGSSAETSLSRRGS